MKLLTLSLTAVFAITLPGLAPSLLADTLSLYNWGFNVDGDIIDKANTPGPLPPSIHASGFNFNEGLGSLTVTVAGAGPHTVAIYFDHDLAAAQPTSDFTADVGSPATGESWEVGPGSKAGVQLFNDFLADSYTDTNSAPQPGDAAVGLAFSFVTTQADPLGIITISVGATPPSSGFYLHQFNTLMGTTPSDIYISASEANSAIPEPASALLFLAPLGLLVWRYTSTHARFLELSSTFSTIRNPRSPSTN
jgi:hypothetical protein